ncbi:hypothetical protein ASG40_15755 [Methylobacterium sp. Leaf399]|uniref:type II toxin-antitoxin system VapB family antitoxin n=1 Tax=Methylobacterium sp. Leaf399 TaxID=1736364 RepID=UPI0006FDA722|nr:type II toxin-antitoxin system VapB family antitoxin [Methylobacterium sp. Leaf399]KQT19109.1 hypothetical protein ASG40_15755 [Methylobacterium sp. Leaf399]
MSITIEDPDFETLLAEVAASAGRNGTDLLVDLLRRERERLDAIESGRLLHRQWTALPMVDDRPIDAILAYDEQGLPC